MTQSDLFTGPGREMPTPRRMDDDISSATGVRTTASQAAGPARLCGRLGAFFEARPNQWIDGRELARVAGAYAWRTRVSDLRHAPHLMTIENRWRHVRVDGSRAGYRVSEYRWVP